MNLHSLPYSLCLPADLELPCAEVSCAVLSYAIPCPVCLGTVTNLFSGNCPLNCRTDTLYHNPAFLEVVSEAHASLYISLLTDKAKDLLAHSLERMRGGGGTPCLRSAVYFTVACGQNVTNYNPNLYHNPFKWFIPARASLPQPEPPLLSRTLTAPQRGAPWGSGYHTR